VWLAWLPFFHGHSHEPVRTLDAKASAGEGLRTVFLSFLALSVTAGAQLVIVLLTGSVALLADTIHNFGDALTAIPLSIAFILGRRAANRRYTYGFGRAEDLAGVAVVLLILVSATVAGWESVRRLLDPQPMTLPWIVAAAGVIGFIGNELVAQWRMRVGKRIGSAALIADGEHARVDGFTSLAVVGAAFGTLIGFPILDPIIGLLITAAILKIVWDQGKVMWHRLMDAVDPALIDKIEKSSRGVAGVEHVEQVRARWIGNKLFVDMYVGVNAGLSLMQAHDVSERVRHEVYHRVNHIGDVQVHVDPAGEAHTTAHAITAHH
jgi:cation diffusion facilitator family transporter